MSPLDVADLLQKLGGYGVAGLMWWFYNQEKKERVRYRDFHEETLKELPALTQALKELTNEVSRRNKESDRPPSKRRGEGG